jgi:hypothetical protein
LFNPGVVPSIGKFRLVFLIEAKPRKTPIDYGRRFSIVPMNIGETKYFDPYPLPDVQICQLPSFKVSGIPSDRQAINSKLLIFQIKPLIADKFVPINWQFTSNHVDTPTMICHIS